MSESLNITYGDENLTISPQQASSPSMMSADASLDNQRVGISQLETTRSRSASHCERLSTKFSKNCDDSSSENINQNDDTESANNAKSNMTTSDMRPIDKMSSDKELPNCSLTPNIQTNESKTLSGGSKGNFVTIPRVQKPQNSRIRKSVPLYEGLQSGSLSRSYQQTTCHKNDTGNSISTSGAPGVSMRRSSSVPCKRTSEERGSTSSSDDSGFSPGSPHTSTVLASFNIEQAIQESRLSGQPNEKANEVPNEAQNKDVLVDIVPTSSASLQK